MLYGVCAWIDDFANWCNDDYAVLPQFTDETKLLLMMQRSSIVVVIRCCIVSLFLVTTV